MSDLRQSARDLSHLLSHLPTPLMTGRSFFAPRNDCICGVSYSFLCFTQLVRSFGSGVCLIMPDLFLLSRLGHVHDSHHISGISRRLCSKVWFQACSCMVHFTHTPRQGAGWSRGGGKSVITVYPRNNEVCVIDPVVIRHRTMRCVISLIGK
jgi:hypothetical protein